MATLNMDAIMGKVNKWAKSSTGKKTMADVIRDYRQNGISKTGAGGDGGFVFTTDMMEKVANELIVALQRSAHHLELGKVLQPSVAEHFNSLFAGYPEMEENDKYVVYIEFTDDLHRDSLLKRDGTRTGAGIDNIVRMFEEGVNTDKGSVFGLWESIGQDVWSVNHRPALGFVQSTIDRFNMKYRGTGCYAVLLWNSVGGE